MLQLKQNERVAPTVPFGSLEAGTVFKWADVVFIKMKQEYKGWNCVRMQSTANGLLPEADAFHDSTLVTPVKATLVIGGDA